MMRDFANWALNAAKLRGATYADARVMDIRNRNLSTKNGQVGFSPNPNRSASAFA